VSRTSGFSKTTSRPGLYGELMTTQQNAATRTAIVPILVYQDIEAAHDFLVGAFGFTSGGLQRDENGNVIHGEVRLGEAAIWLHAVAAEHQMTSPRASSQSHGGLEIIVEDVDAHYTRSKAAGADIDYPPADKAYGLREYGARDPENHRWWFSTPLAH
jgi:MerR family transcriptional regulator, thiopeptide resistance regulator